MDGQSVFSYSHKRSLNTKTLESSKNVKVSADRSIDPVLLFQRFLVVSQTGNLRLDDVMSYELCLYPMSLFKGKGLLRQTDKPQLAEAIRNYVKTKSDSGVQQTVLVTEHNVLDGGSLLQHLKWKERSTYNSIADDYASFTVENYGRATVVFDGWTKYKGRCASVNITEATIFSGKKDDFLSNGANKQALIQLIKERMKQKGCDVIQAEGDADVEIVKAATCMSAFRPTSLIGEDTDLVLLLFHTDVSKCTALYFRSNKVLKQVHCEAVCNDLLFLHAFTGCDSVSRVFGIGKKFGVPANHQKRKDDERLFKSILSAKANAGCCGNQWF